MNTPNTNQRWDFFVDVTWSTFEPCTYGRDNSSGFRTTVKMSFMGSDWILDEETLILTPDEFADFESADDQDEWILDAMRDEIRWAVDSMIEKACKAQAEYETEHDDAGGNYIGACFEPANCRRDDFDEYLRDNWSIDDQSILDLIWDHVPFDYVEPRPGHIYASSPKWTDGVTLDSWAVGEIEIEIDALFDQGGSKYKQVCDFLDWAGADYHRVCDSPYAYWSTDASWCAVLLDEEIESTIDGLIEAGKLELVGEVIRLVGVGR